MNAAESKSPALDSQTLRDHDTPFCEQVNLLKLAIGIALRRSNAGSTVSATESQDR